jgi:iron-sulfur cluster assembly protein
METTTSPIKISTTANKELLNLFAGSSNEKEQFLRIGVKGGGCSGLSYLLALDEKKEGDEIHDIDGIPCVINPAHAIYLFGMEIDWKNGLDARGFIFNNPNASATCGCGTSFAV